MRSVRLLWGAIGVLLACVLALTILLTDAKRSQLGSPLPSVPPDKAAAAEREKAVAVVGGKTIRYGELMTRLSDKYGAELLSQLMDREAIRQEAEELQVTVSRGEIESELARMQQGYESVDVFYKSM
jgi:foldase protein PrsA